MVWRNKTKGKSYEHTVLAGFVAQYDKKNAAPRTRVETRTYQNGVVFDTFDEAVGDPVFLQGNIISH